MGAGELGPVRPEVRSMSPSPAAASRASTIACATASPSECPDKATSPGNSSPASHNAPSPPNAVDVGAMPTWGPQRNRSRRGDGRQSFGKERPCAVEIGGRRDLERHRVPLHRRDRVTGGCHGGGVIGVIRVRVPQRRPRARHDGSPAASAPRPARNVRPPRHAAVGVDALDGVDHRHGRDDGDGSRVRSRPRPVDTAGGVSARAASWTRTVSTSAHSAASRRKRTPGASRRPSRS